MFSSGSTRWVIALLALIATGMSVLVYLALPSHPGRLGGGFFLAIGLLHVLFHKKTGRKFFAKTQSSRAFVANFWALGGEEGTQLLFLGIGLILAASGCVLIILGPA